MDDEIVGVCGKDLIGPENNLSGKDYVRITVDTVLDNKLIVGGGLLCVVGQLVNTIAAAKTDKKHNKDNRLLDEINKNKSSKKWKGKGKK